MGLYGKDAITSLALRQKNKNPKSKGSLFTILLVISVKFIVCSTIFKSKLTR